MKRPDFNAAQVAQVLTNQETGSAAVKLLDDKRNALTVNLGPEARVSLVQYLLSRPPVGRPGEALEAGIRLQAHDVAIFDHRGTAVLEVSLGLNQAIHIGLPGVLSESLLALLQLWQKDQPAPGASH